MDVFSANDGSSVVLDEFSDLSLLNNLDTIRGFNREIFEALQLSVGDDLRLVSVDDDQSELERTIPGNCAPPRCVRG